MKKLSVFLSFLAVLAVLLSFSCNKGPADPGDVDGGTSSTSSGATSSSSSSAAGSSYYYQDGWTFPAGNYGTFDVTSSNFNNTTGAPAGSTSCISIQTIANGGVWMNADPIAQDWEISLSAISTKFLVFDLYSTNSIQVKWETKTGETVEGASAKWVYDTAAPNTWQTIAVPIADFVNFANGCSHIPDNSSFDPARVTTLVFVDYQTPAVPLDDWRIANIRISDTDPTAGSSSSSSSASSSSSGGTSSSSSAGGFTFNPAAPVYYDDGMPSGWLDSTHYGVFDYTADYNYTADTPASASAAIRLTDSAAAWTGLWFNASDAGTLDLTAHTGKNLVFEYKGPDSINVKFENVVTANFAAGWFGGTGTWETITIPIADFISGTGTCYHSGTFTASAANSLVFVEDHTTTVGQDYLIANIRIE